MYMANYIWPSAVELAWLSSVSPKSEVSVGTERMVTPKANILSTQNACQGKWGPQAPRGHYEPGHV